jgi:hypothetical protein
MNLQSNSMPFRLGQFVVVVLLVSIWINISEVFRYFVIVMPGMREHLNMVPDVAPMDWGVFAIWGVWDTILTLYVVGLAWLFASRFGFRTRVAIAAGTFAWAGFFLLFWVGMYNMRLTTMSLLSMALPLAWLEMVVGAWLAMWLFGRRFENHEVSSTNQSNITFPVFFQIQPGVIMYRRAII